MGPEGRVSELLVIVAICLLVFGAERLPGVARTFGSFVRRYTDRSKKP
jgi:Sec-independent protein translocase protein TatA